MQNWPGVLTGGCLCGDIRYELKGPALFVGQCCCKDCQKATGTGHTTIIGVMRPQLSLQGSPRTYACKGDTGGDVVRHFCERCGGRLYTTGSSIDEVVIVQAGSLDGITRRVVIQLAEQEKISIIQQNLTRYDLYTADEFFMTGTGAEVIGVVQIDGRQIGDGRPGPITCKLRQKFFAYARS